MEWGEFAVAVPWLDDRVQEAHIKHLRTCDWRYRSLYGHNSPSLSLQPGRSSSRASERERFVALFIRPLFLLLSQRMRQRRKKYLYIFRVAVDAQKAAGTRRKMTTIRPWKLGGISKLHVIPGDSKFYSIYSEKKINRAIRINRVSWGVSNNIWWKERYTIINELVTFLQIF